MTGTAGADGGLGGSADFDGGGGGGGGAGGYGALVSGAGLASSIGAVKAGAGGAGGDGGPVDGGVAGAGGGGGDGGIGLAFSGASLDVFGNISGGVGGKGGVGGITLPLFAILFGTGGDGGSGGNGGAALTFAGGAASNLAVVRGGNGGAGGLGADSYGSDDADPTIGGKGGNGGNGGAGIVLSAGSSLTFDNSENGHIFGGNGGMASPGAKRRQSTDQDPPSNGAAGVTGAGGAGLVMLASSGSIQNEGSIQGGIGGPINPMTGGTPTTAGTGGAGLSISGDSNLIVSSGSIQGGTSGDGLTLAPAIELAGNFNTIALLDGATLTGNITASGSGNTLDLYGNGDIASAITGLLQVTNQATGSWVLRGAIAGTTLVTVDGGHLTLAADNTYTNGTTITAGTLQLGDGGTTGSVVGDIANDGVLSFKRSDTPVYAGRITGTGSVTQEGTGTLTLTGINTYTGATVINAGTLALTGAGSIAASSGVQVQGAAAFDVTNVGGTTASVRNLSGAGSVHLGAKTLDITDANGSFSGAIDGTGTLIKHGAGTLALMNGSTYAGGTALKEGRLDIGNDAALGTGELAMDDGTTLGFAADGLTLSNALRTTGLGDPVIDTQNFSATLAGSITGAGFLTKQGAGTLTLTATNTYTGDTDVAAGSLRAGATNTFSAASAHTVAAGATLDLAGFSQSIASLSNSGTVSLVGSAPGTTLTVTGAYVGSNGVLRVGTMLGTDGSVSDRLILDGPGAVVSGHTSVQVTNIGGLGGLTTGNGIEVISAAHGATTTAQTSKDAFALAGGHVDAGAYEYRLYAATAAGSGENWYLRSTTTGTPTGPTNPGSPGNPGDPGDPTDPTPPTGPTSPTNPGTPSLPAAPSGGVPTYRGEVPLLAALPEQVREASLTMLGNLHERIGDDGMQADTASAPDSDRHSWGRVLNSDLELRQGGVVDPQSRGHLNGFQAGTDVFASRNWRAGAYLGQLDGDMNVDGLARGVENLDVGHNDLRNRYLGIYGTYVGEHGLYADTVVQAGQHRYTIDALDSTNADARGNSLLVSLEMGQSFMLSGHWAIEPQLQIVHQGFDMDDVALTGARVRLDSDAGWLGRAGVRVKGVFTTGADMLQPYARINVYKASGGEDVARFIGPAATTDIATRVGSTSTELAAGLTWTMTGRVSIYGELGRLWGTSGEQVDSPFKGSIGLRLSW